MTYKGDFAPGAVLDFKFNTRDTDGAPITLAGTPSLAAYKDNSVTQDTDGLTLSVDFDSVTGLHNVRVDTSADGTFYSTGSSFQIVIAAGTVDAISVVGVVVGEFTLGRAASYGRLGAPAGASVSADIAAVKVDTAATLVDTAEIGAAGAGLTAINLPDQTMNITGNITGNLSGSVGSVTGAVGSVTGAVGSVSGAVGSVTAGVTVTTNNDKTGYQLSATGSAALTEGYAADGAAATLPQLLYMIWAMLAEKNIASTTLTAKKLDGTTDAMTFTLDSDTSPTSITRAT